MIGYHSRISYGQEDITFQVRYTGRKTLEIAVHPDSRVVVKAPRGTDPLLIETRLIKRARWIKRQLDYFRQFEPRTPPRRYVGGETHLYLGRRYRLKAQDGDTDSVKLTRGYFWVTCKGSAEPERVKGLLERWYFERARGMFAERLEQCWPDFQRRGLKRPALHIRKVKTRWGSLSPRGVMMLNVDLIRTPSECIDYVITHELCHLKYRNHSTEYYRLLEQVMPDWERRKIKLELALV